MFLLVLRRHANVEQQVAQRHGEVPVRQLEVPLERLQNLQNPKQRNPEFWKGFENRKTLRRNHMCEIPNYSGNESGYS